ncbi:MAG TPA: hypothetical protein VLH35_05430 [Candidatus Acidoferrales bacterium]|nr:hypothetical protein [Candidatus Acidoferrales bacterium]
MTIKKILQTCYTHDALEFTLSVGCPVNCQKYCPQEVFLEKYGNKDRMMSFNTFKRILSNVPKSVSVNFAGFCEPFMNPDFARMAEYAHYNGYRLQVSTTLFGAKASDVEKLINLEYEVFCIHIRDGKIVKFPLTPEYQDNVFRIIEGIPNVVVTIMNELFKTNNRENVTRGLLPQKKQVGFCQKLETPQFVVLPNGDTTLCCMDFGLKHPMGNLLTEEYTKIRADFVKKKTGHSLCAYCSFNTPYSKLIYNRAISKGKNVLKGIASGKLLPR